MPNLNKAQKILLAIFGLGILWIQFSKFSDYGVEGTGWVISLVVAALLILPSLTLLPTKKINSGAPAKITATLQEHDCKAEATGLSAEHDSKSKAVADAQEIKELLIAVRRLSPTHSESHIRAVGPNLLRRFANPYIAAMEAHTTMLKAIAQRGEIDPSTLGALIAFSSEGICKFVIEGKVPHEIGKKYFDLVMAHMNTFLPNGLEHSGELMSFDAMLKLHRTH